jgi:hypothetical protein
MCRICAPYDEKNQAKCYLENLDENKQPINKDWRILKKKKS